MKKMIVKPLDYIKIVWNETNSSGKTKNSKKFIDLYIPLSLSLFFSIIMTILYSLAGYKFFFQSESFNLLTNFLQTLPGFYIAALAAIVSFNNERLDEIDFDDCPLDVKGLNMTFRRFLTNTFAYLAWISIFLILYCLILKYVFENNQLPSNKYISSLIYALLFVPFSFFFGQLVTITAMSLSYLGDRILRP